MAVVYRYKNESFEAMLGRFKRKAINENIAGEFKKRKCFVSKGQKEREALNKSKRKYEKLRREGRIQ